MFFSTDVCECLASIYNTGSSLPPDGGNGKNGKDTTTSFQHLCFGVAAEPCLCILNTICTVRYVHIY